MTYKTPKGFYWYELEAIGPAYESLIQSWYCGKVGRVKARMLAKEMSEKQPDTDFVINGYDISEIWRNGKNVSISKAN